MMKSGWIRIGCAFVAAAGLAAVSASAQQSSHSGRPVISGESQQDDHPLRLAMASQDKAPKAERTMSDKTTVRTETKTVATA